MNIKYKKYENVNNMPINIYDSLRVLLGTCNLENIFKIHVSNKDPLISYLIIENDVNVIANISYVSEGSTIINRYGYDGKKKNKITGGKITCVCVKTEYRGSEIFSMLFYYFLNDKIIINSWLSPISNPVA